MLPSKMSVNKKLLPIKGHFFLFNAGTAPLVPYLSTYARQLGFSSSTVGLIYIVLPIFGLVAKPLFGIIADRFQIQKSLFILFQIVTIISFAAIYFIPDSGSEVSVDLDCGNGGTVLRSCYNTAEHIDQCKVASLGSQNSTALCKMSCDMTSPKMWQTVCEHWHLPQYCYSNTKSIKYTSYISNVTSKDSCVFISSNNVTLDGFSYKPSCRFGSGYVDINEPCSLNCSNQHLATLIGPNKANMTCLDNTLTYRLCDYDAQNLANVTSEITLGKCQTSCELDPQTPWRLMEICEGWGADAADTCHPKTKVGESFPDSLSFDGIILLSSTLAEHKCVYIQLNHIQMMDGLHYPFCSSKDVYQINTDMFHSTCNITCDNEMVNELFKSASETHKSEETQYTKQFWLFFLLMIISWIGQAVVVTFADAICFNLLGTKISQYGKQRLWGSVGFGIFSLLTGVLIDVFSEGTVKNYTVAFLLMFVFMSGDVIVSCYLKVESTKMSVNILTDVGSVLKSLPTFVFMLWTIAVGLCTGLIWQFLFWHIEDVSGMTCDGADYVKTLQGMVSAIQTFGGEIPFMFVSGYLLRKFGHANTMSLVLFAFGLRFILYSIVTNPWWILPIEMLQGITFGMFYPTMTSYATVVSPPGTETTVQGLVGAVFEGVGTSLGSFIGGRLYDAYGGWNTFQYFGIGAFAACALHMLAQYALGKRNTQVAWNQGNYTPIIKYGQEDDAVYILEDLNESS